MTIHCHLSELALIPLRAGSVKPEGWIREQMRLICSMTQGIIPYYVNGMWYDLNREPGLFAMLFGPSQMETVISGVPVKVKQETLLL